MMGFTIWTILFYDLVSYKFHYCVFVATFKFFVDFFIALLLWRRYEKLARILLVSVFWLFWLLSTPFVSEQGVYWLESKTLALTDNLPEADAIVILGAGTYFHAPEYDYQDIVGIGALPRLHYGAKLYRSTHKPILVSGGKPLGDYVPESEQMRVTLEQDLLVPVTWSENASDNTFENARNTFRLLEQSGIKRIYLVTHAWHMLRAAQAFRHAGFVVIEAPTGFTTHYRLDALAFLPSISGLQCTSVFVHEMIGLLWYQIRFLN